MSPNFKTAFETTFLLVLVSTCDGELERNFNHTVIVLEKLGNLSTIKNRGQIQDEMGGGVGG